jgi:hypothetical protein
MLVERVPMERARFCENGLSRQGVEEHDVGFIRAAELHLLHDEVEVDGVEVEIALALQMRVDGNEVVAPGHLQPVPGVEEDGRVGVFQEVGEIAHLGVERALVEVDTEDDVEAGALQRRGDLVGVVDRIGELRDLLVGGVADHERDALFRGGGECEEEAGCEEREDGGERAGEDAVHGGYQAGGRNWRPRSHQTSLADLGLGWPHRRLLSYVKPRAARAAASLSLGCDRATSALDPKRK